MANYVADKISQETSVAIIGLYPSNNYKDEFEGHFFNGKKERFWSLVATEWFSLEPNDLDPEDDDIFFEDSNWSFLYLVNEPYDNLQQLNEDPDLIKDGIDKIKNFIIQNHPPTVIFAATQIARYLFGRYHTRPGTINNNLINWIPEETTIYILPSPFINQVTYSKQQIYNFYSGLSDLFIESDGEEEEEEEEEE